jgi:alpha-beta hydrolase superfamily lysophospholipase
MKDEDENKKPIFILGHSMGGLIAVLAVLERQDLFKVQFFSDSMYR